MAEAYCWSVWDILDILSIGDSVVSSKMFVWVGRALKPLLFEDSSLKKSFVGGGCFS